MKKKGGVLMISVSVVLIAALALASYFYFNRDMFDKGKMPVDVYFLNLATGNLEPERRFVPKGDNSAIVNKVFDIIYQGPSSNNHARYQMADLKILDARLTHMENRSILELEFSKEYMDMPSTDELFFRAALVWTMTGLDFISDVSFYVEGQKLLKNDGSPMDFLNRSNVLINPEISPDKVEYQNILLYFPDSSLSFLYAEERSIQVNPDVDIEKYIVEHLISGPKLHGLVSTIPSETRLRSIKREGDTCYVSLNTDFINKHTGGPAVQNITVYSIVNSLTELRYVNKVQFLIEAEKINDFRGGFDLSKPIEREESLIHE